MSNDKRLKLSAVAFAVLWAAGMIWWSGTYEPANLIVTSVCGVLTALAWYWVMAKWQRRTLARKNADPAA